MLSSTKEREPIKKKRTAVTARGYTHIILYEIDIIEQHTFSQQQQKKIKKFPLSHIIMVG